MEQLAQGITTEEYCLDCHGCCRFAEQESPWAPHLLKEEIALVAPVAGKIELISNPQQGNFMCQFFNASQHTCRIYANRPFECRLYPFVLNRQGSNIYLALDIRCPITKTIPKEQYREYVQYLASFFAAPANQTSLKNNPQLIQSYEGVLNIFVIK